MSKLLRANFTRLLRSISLKIGVIGLFVFAIAIVINQHIDALYNDYTVWMDNGLFAVAILAVFPLAVFIPLYIGTEYGDGTMRNKVIIGHTRRDIYLSNLITAIVAAAIVWLAWVIPYIGLGSLLLSRKASWLFILCILAAILSELIVFSTIFTFISMVNANKAISSVLCLLISIILLFSGIFMKSRLEEPEFYSGYSLIVDGKLEEGKPEPNPNYLPAGSMKRKVFEFLLDFTPSGQAIVLSQAEGAKSDWYTIYNCFNLLALTGAGYFIYKKKDLK